ncbi:hypothetical protein PR048_016537 [Dryococelus australis]|uniref:Uncharacterized protein n=1 Tax=Dryococelus australis TaxID=614101 RepID=A0ABQ9HKG2_9NEOP|nr:hypothetical protein PR048_016537 [Dryococelus australis]
MEGKSVTTGTMLLADGNIVLDINLCVADAKKKYNILRKISQLTNLNYWRICLTKCVLTEAVNESCSALGVSLIKVQKHSGSARKLVLKKVFQIATIVSDKLQRPFNLDPSLQEENKEESKFYVVRVEYETLNQEVGILSLLAKSGIMSICEKCPNIEQVREAIVKDVEKFEIKDEVKYKQWLSTDRCQLLELVILPEKFVETLLENHEDLKLYHYIIKKQS